MSTLVTILKATRGPFLLLTPVCVFLGTATAVYSGYAVDIERLGLILAGALLAHISVNTLNEYYDFRSGLDLATQRTPFSGGSGALPAYPRALNAVFATGVFSLTACLLIGVYFAWSLGLAIVPIGLLGAVLIVTYTEWLNRSPLLCLIAPGTGFGLLMVAGTFVVLAGEYSPLPWIAGLVPFFLVNNLLLLNQYPDIDADRAAGRHHFPIAHGVSSGTIMYALFNLAAIATVAIATITGSFPASALVSLMPFPLALFVLHGMRRYGERIGSHPQYLAANVALTLLAPAILGLALVYTR